MDEGVLLGRTPKGGWTSLCSGTMLCALRREAADKKAGMPELSPELSIAKGLLPENLPPAFDTRQLWSALPGMEAGYLVGGNVKGQPCAYNASKRGGQRRTFSVPHPVYVREQALFLRKHWPHILGIFDAATGSASRPVIDEAGPRHIRITPHQELPRLQLQRLSRYRYCLVTDVSRFYPSVYTHALPWAINGKSAAKLDTSPQSPKVFGNRLDYALRQSQSSQTVGIAVGPDTCKVVAEILMSAVTRKSSACAVAQVETSADGDHADLSFVRTHSSL